MTVPFGNCKWLKITDTSGRRLNEKFDGPGREKERVRGLAGATELDEVLGGG